MVSIAWVMLHEMEKGRGKDAGDEGRIVGTHNHYAPPISPPDFRARGEVGVEISLAMRSKFCKGKASQETSRSPSALRPESMYSRHLPDRLRQTWPRAERKGLCQHASRSSRRIIPLTIIDIVDSSDLRRLEGLDMVVPKLEVLE